MGASYAFSPIGVSGVAAGGGDTGNGRYTTSVKYRINAGMFHAAATYQFGGYQQDNSSTGTYEAGFGADVPLPQDYGKLALDAIYKRASNAVSLAPLSAAQNALHPGTLAATISDNTAQMALAKWTDGPLTVSGGYEHILYENPSNPQTAFTSVGGYFVASADITNNAYTIHKQLQIMWIGAKYAVTPKIDVTGAYYHYLQNNYNAASCRVALDALSADIVYHVLPKFDAYAGMMFSEVNNGLANGYIYRTNVDPVAGIRMKF